MYPAREVKASQNVEECCIHDFKNSESRFFLFLALSGGVVCMDGVDTIGNAFASSPFCVMLPRISGFTSGKSQGFVSTMSSLQESIMLVQLALIYQVCSPTYFAFRLSSRY